MELLIHNKNKSELLYWYFENRSSKATHDDNATYAIKSFLHNNPEENGASAHSLLDEALMAYADEELMLDFYHPKVFRLLADIMSSVQTIRAFPLNCGTEQEINRNSQALWREIGVLLSNGVQLYWMYFPDLKKKKDRDFREYRAGLLESAYRPPDTFMQNLKSIRNVHVHFDEYMDEIFRCVVLKGRRVLDQAVAEHAKIDTSQIEVSRLYDPSTSILHHLGKESSSARTELFTLNLEDLSSMAMSILTTYQVNMVVPGWRFGIRLDMIPFWGDSRG